MKENTIRRSLKILTLFLFIPIWLSAQSVAVRGTVSDASGEPLIGVSVVEKGTTNGTVTDIDGKYTINVPSKATLNFSYMGYTEQAVIVQGKTLINVTLEEDTQLLDEVVVVGYGHMKRSDLTGSLASVSSEVISKSVVTSLDQVLQGRAAGVQVQQNTGLPGGSSSIRIRGINSLNASNEPIFVIDGVVIDGETKSGSDNALASINPSDIVSMDILKDASATAIYGSRGANGVIIITTKRGTKGEASINYNGYVGWQQMPKKMDMMDLRQYATHKNERAELGIVERDNAFVRPDLLGSGTDWQDEMFKTAFMTSHNLSVTGGNDKSTYSLSAGHLDQDGIAVGSGFKRLNLSGSFDAQVKKNIKVGLNFAFSNSNQNITVSDQSLIKTALKQTPNVAVRNADGNFDGPDTDEYVQNNPIGLAMIKKNDIEKTGIRGNTYGEATIIEGLTYRTELSFDYGITNAHRFDPTYQFGALKNEISEGNQAKSYNKFWTWRNIVTYNRTHGLHAVNGMLGQEMQKSAWEYLSGYRSGFLTNGATDLDLGDSKTARINGNSGASSLLSYFGRLFYSFDNKYMVTATLRHDGSSKFHPDHRWGWFPSAALAWRVTGEEFLRDHAVINNLKLRLGWGSVGNQNTPNHGYTAIYSSVPTNWGTGLLASNTPNEGLKWETTSSTNLGLDLSILQNRIEFIADVYYKKTNNLLYRLTLPAYVGTEGQGAATAPWANIGSLENKGIELTLNTTNVRSKDFEWTSNIVFSMNRNKVKELATETSLISSKLQEGSDITILARTAVGEPIGQYYGYKVIGRFEKATDFYYKDENGEIKPTALPKNMYIDKNSAWIGDYIFEDVNNDGVIDDNDLTYIGNPEPKFTFGIGNTFTYKDFDLSIFLTGSYGNDVVNYQRRWLENPRENHNLLSKAGDYARLALINPNGPEDFRNVQIVGGAWDMPRIAASSASSTSNFRFSDKFVEDGSYLRIQSVAFGYTIPRKLTSRIGVQNLKVYMNLQNLYTFTKYSGYDPEIGSLNQDALMTGVDNARYPSPRIYTFGVNVTF